MDATVGVIGLGAAGSAALWRAARRGASVLGFERYTPGHDRGSSHGHSRLFRMVTSEGPIYAELARRSYGLWRELEQVSGQRLLELVGGLSIGAPESALIRDVTQVAAQTGLPVELLESDQLRARFPQHAYRPNDVGVLDPNTGFLRPERAISAACAAAVADGAHIVRNTPVQKIVASDIGVDIVTAERTFTVDTAVVAAGAWQTQLLPHMAAQLMPRRAVLSWFQPRAGERQRYMPPAFTVFTHDVGPVSGWGVPLVDEYGVKVGMQDNEGYPIDDPSANQAEVAPWELEAVTQFVASYLPGIVPTVTNARGCMITMTPDSGFSIGVPADLPRVVVLSACSGHGFKHAAAVGDLGAELAVTGTTTFDITQFSPDRFAPVG